MAVMQPYARLDASTVNAAVPRGWRAGALLAVSLLAFVAADIAWISFSNDIYSSRLHDILRPHVDATAAAASWLCIVGMVQAFVLPRTIGCGISSALYQVCLWFCLFLAKLAHA